MKYLPRDVAFGKMKAMVEARRSCERSFHDAALPRRAHRQLRAPEALLNAARAHKAGTMDDQGPSRCRTRRSRGSSRSRNRSACLDHRRRVPPPQLVGGFIDAVDGFGCATARSLPQRDRRGRRVGRLYAKAPLKRKRRIVADDYRFLKSMVKKGVPKVTIAAPDVMHYFLGPKAFEAYKDREAYFADLVKIYREEIRISRPKGAPTCSSTTPRCRAIATARARGREGARRGRG